MVILNNIPFEPNIDSLFKTLRIDKESQDASDVLNLVETVKPQINPKVIYKISYIQNNTIDEVVIDGVTFNSRVLHINLNQVERVFPFIATCGREADAIEIPQDDFLTRYWFDTIKGMALDVALKYFRNHLKKKYALRKFASMSPGSGPHDTWLIEQQRPLFSLFGNVEELIGVRLTESFLMIPNKSVSGICFPTEISFETCQLCSRENCRGRRAAYDKKLAEITLVQNSILKK